MSSYLGSQAQSSLFVEVNWIVPREGWKQCYIYVVGKFIAKGPDSKLSVILGEISEIIG